MFAPPVVSSDFSVYTVRSGVMCFVFVYLDVVPVAYMDTKKGAIISPLCPVLSLVYLLVCCAFNISNIIAFVAASMLSNIFSVLLVSRSFAFCCSLSALFASLSHLFVLS